MEAVIFIGIQATGKSTEYQNFQTAKLLLTILGGEMRMPTGML